MTPEVTDYLEKARQCLRFAQININVQLGNDAGRNAYLAAFHAAQAYIFFRKGAAAKSHNGVHSEFSRLTREEPSIDKELRRFLSQAYNLKAVADYDTGPDSTVPLEQARIALIKAESFVEHIAKLLATP